MPLLKRWFGGRTAEPDLAPLYAEVVAAARAPLLYREGRVPDTLDGRFDMLAAMLSLVLLRLEALEGGPPTAARLTERFVADMDAQLREAGVGDVVVGKQVGRMMGALGGRLAAYRAAFEEGAPPKALADALVRNVYRGTPPDGERVGIVADALRAFGARMAGLSLAELEAGRL